MTRNHSTVHSRSENGARMKTSCPSYRKPFTGKIKFAPTRSAFRFHQIHSVRHFPAQIFVSRLNFAFEADCHFSISPPPPGYVILSLLFCWINNMQFCRRLTLDSPPPFRLNACNHDGEDSST